MSFATVANDLKCCLADHGHYHAQNRILESYAFTNVNNNNNIIFPCLCGLLHQSGPTFLTCTKNRSISKEDRYR